MRDLDLTSCAETSLAYPLFHPRCRRPRPSSLTASEFKREFKQHGPSHESAFVEFKEGFSSEKIGAAVVAFSNADGGVVLIGVRDDATVKGAGLSGEREAWLHQTVANLHDPGTYEVSELHVDDRCIVALSVHRREEGVAQTADGRVLARRGASNMPLVGRDLSELMAHRSLKRFERTATDVSRAVAESELLNALAEAWGWGHGNVDARLREQGFATDDRRLTVAGVLYRTPEPKRVLDKAF